MSCNNTRCGECGSKGLEYKNVKGEWSLAWCDFPSVTVQEDLELPVCPKCGNVIIPGECGKLIDIALEKSVTKLTKGLLESVHKQNAFTYRKIGELMGVTPEYISMLLHEKKRPSFQFVQLLKVFLLHPEIIPELSA